MGFMSKVKGFIFNPQYDEGDYDDISGEESYDYGDPTISAIETGGRVRRAAEPRMDARAEDRGDTVSFSPPKKAVSKTGPDILHMPIARIIECQPINFDDAASMVSQLKDEKILVVKMDHKDIESGHRQRIIDFLSGAVACVEGEITQASDLVFLVTPRNVEVTSQDKEHLKASGIFSAFKASVGGR